MSGWDGWAKGACDRGAAGAAVYDPCTGGVWGRSGDLCCDGEGDLHSFDEKGEGKDACCPKVNGQKYIFLRQTTSDKGGKINVFKAGPDSFVTLPGPSGGRIAAVTKSEKPEILIDKLKDITN